jgi:ribulose-phosphate 3-epimerase
MYPVSPSCPVVAEPTVTHTILRHTTSGCTGSAARLLAENGGMGKRLGKGAVERLRGRNVVLPSFLQCDFGNLELEIRQLEAAGVEALHLDVMDGHFVPNLSYGMPIVEAIRRLTDLPLDVHLMISNPLQYVGQFIKAGADIVTVHTEVAEDIRLTIEAIRSGGAGVGLAINPATNVNVLEALLPECDLVLIMSVNAGFGGQAFNPVALDKLRWLPGSFARSRRRSQPVDNSRLLASRCQDVRSRLCNFRQARLRTSHHRTKQTASKLAPSLL